MPAEHPIQATIRQIDQRIESLDKQARQAIEASPVLAKQMRDIQQVPGIKTVVAPVLRAELGDLGSYSRNAWGGRDRGSHLAKGGSKRARCALHLAARSLFRSKGPLRDHIEYLQARGMSKASITGVMMRKLLVVARAVVRNDGLYDPGKIRFAQL